MPLQSQSPLLGGKAAIDLGDGAMLRVGETAEELRPELLKLCATKVMEQPHAVEPGSPGVKYLRSRRPVEREFLIFHRQDLPDTKPGSLQMIPQFVAHVEIVPPGGQRIGGVAF